MTIKELKEKIKEKPRKAMNVEWTKLVPIEFFKLLNEDLDIEKILEDKYLLTYQAKKCLKELYKQYNDNFIKELENFIGFASKKLPNFEFTYDLINKKNTVNIWIRYINNNKLMSKSILYHTVNGKINYNWLLARIINSTETP